MGGGASKTDSPLSEPQCSEFSKALKELDDEKKSDSSDDKGNPRDSNGLSRTEKLAHDLKDLLLSGNDSDVTIRVKGKSFGAHRSILGARTPVFASMFRHKMKEKTTGVVDIDDCEADVFSEFLHYVYTGSVEHLTEENAFGLYTVADKYQVEELKADCVECLMKVLSVDNFSDVVTLAVRHGEKDLLKLATAFFADKMKEILLTVKWQIFMDQNSTQANELLIKAIVVTSTEKKEGILDKN